MFHITCLNTCSTRENMGVLSSNLQFYYEYVYICIVSMD